MLTLLTIATAAYLSRRINAHFNDDGISVASIDHAQIWSDLIAMLTLIGTVCGWAIDRGRSTRQYFNNELQPWLERRGITINLPLIDLPRLPWGQTEAPIAE